MSSPTRTRPATAADVATRAGVSRTTVSHILNGREARFPEETRQRVYDAAAALDYRPSPAGRTLKNGHSDTVVVVMPRTTMGNTVQDALEQLSTDLGADINVLFRFADPDPEVTIASLLTLRPLAVVDFGSLHGPERDRLAANGVPCVPDERRPQTQGGLGLEDAIAAIQVAALTKNGPRPIVFAGFIDDRADPYGPRRMESMIRACERLGLPAPKRIDVAPVLDSGLAALRRVEGFPVGIAAYNDTVALTLLAAARELRIDVPGDLSIVGMDNTVPGQLWRPRLSSIEMDMRSFMDDAVRQVIAQLHDVLNIPAPLPAAHTNHDVLTFVAGETS